MQVYLSSQYTAMLGIWHVTVAQENIYLMMLRLGYLENH